MANLLGHTACDQDLPHESNLQNVEFYSAFSSKDIGIVEKCLLY